MDSRESFELIRKVNSLNQIQQYFFYKNLENNGFSKEDIDNIKIAVSAYKLFATPDRYKAMKNAFIEQYAKELFNQFQNK